MVAFVDYGQGAYCLQISAGSNAPLATDTLTIVFHYRRGAYILLLILWLYEVKKNMVTHAIFARKALQFTVPVFEAFCAIGVVF